MLQKRETAKIEGKLKLYPQPTLRRFVMRAQLTAIAEQIEESLRKNQSEEQNPETR